MKVKCYAIIWPKHRRMRPRLIYGAIRHSGAMARAAAVNYYGGSWQNLFARGYRCVPITVTFADPQEKVTDPIERSMFGLDA